jgi:hypothetical protein
LDRKYLKQRRAPTGKTAETNPTGGGTLKPSVGLSGII